MQLEIQFTPMARTGGAVEARLLLVDRSTILREMAIVQPISRRRVVFDVPPDDRFRLLIRRSTNRRILARSGIFRIRDGDVSGDRATRIFALERADYTINIAQLLAGIDPTLGIGGTGGPFFMNRVRFEGVTIGFLNGRPSINALPTTRSPLLVSAWFFFGTSPPSFPRTGPGMTRDRRVQYGFGIKPHAADFPSRNYSTVPSSYSLKSQYPFSVIPGGLGIHRFTSNQLTHHLRGFWDSLVDTRFDAAVSAFTPARFTPTDVSLNVNGYASSGFTLTPLRVTQRS